MQEATAREIAEEFIRREQIVDFDQARVAVREVGQSLASTMPDSEIWAVVDTVPTGEGDESERWILVLADGALYRAFSTVYDNGIRAIGCERIPLSAEVRMHITDNEIYDDGAHRCHRAFSLQLTATVPPLLTFMVNWIRELEDRTPSREEAFGVALARALDWELGEIPREFGSG